MIDTTKYTRLERIAKYFNVEEDLIFNIARVAMLALEYDEELSLVYVAKEDVDRLIKMIQQQNIHATNYKFKTLLERVLLEDTSDIPFDVWDALTPDTEEKQTI